MILLQTIILFTAILFSISYIVKSIHNIVNKSKYKIRSLIDCIIALTLWSSLYYLTNTY